MKKLLCMVLCLAMVVSMMVVTVSATTRLVYNTPVVNDTYEDGTTSAFTWTTAHKSSGIVSGTGFNGKANYNDPGSKYMNFFSNLVTQANLDANKDNNINFISGLKSYMKGDINYISFDFSSANIARNIAVFLDSASEYNTTALPALLFRTAGNYYAGTHANLKPWSYYNTKGFLNNDYHNALGSALGSYSGKEWYNVKFVVDNTSDTDNVSIYVEDSLVNTVSYADSENFDCLIIKDYTVNAALIAGFGIDNVKVGTVSKEEVPEVDDSDFVLTNSETVNGTTVTGVKEEMDYDETRAKYVRRFNFDAKAYGEDKAGSTDVRASLDGFKQFMTDPNVNTISFDYKITGTSNGHIGLFLSANVDDYKSTKNTGVCLNNSQGISLQAKMNWNGGYSNWYALTNAASQQQALPNNREWNRLTLEVNKQTGDVKAYINRKKFTICSNTVAPANPPINMNSICFQTAGAVANDGDLAILFDNITVYPGKAKTADVDRIEIVDKDGNAINEFNAEDTVYANAGVKNETSSQKNYIAILAVYDKFGACVDVKLHELKDIQAGGEGFVDGTTLGIKLPNDAVTVKAFLWNTWDSITPICDFDTATLKAAE